MGVAKYVKNEKDAIEEVIYQSGIRVKPVYTPQDLEAVGFDYEKDLGDPGQYPFTRSLHPGLSQPSLDNPPVYRFWNAAGNQQTL